MASLWPSSKWRFWEEFINGRREPWDGENLQSEKATRVEGISKVRRQLRYSGKV